MINEFYIAFDKAALVNKRVRRDKGFVSCNDVVEVVREIIGYDQINVVYYDFSKVEDLECVSATSTVKITQEERVANIVVNSSLNAKMKRFVIVHELGHLLFEGMSYFNVCSDCKKHTVSSLVNPDITAVSESRCRGSSYAMAEQMANVFAVLVLIPDDIKMKDLKSNVRVLSAKYEVPSEALYSRMILSFV